MDALHFHLRQRVATKAAKPVLPSGCPKMPAIGRDVPVPVDTVGGEGRVIGLPLKFRCLRQYTDGSEK